MCCYFVLFSLSKGNIVISLHNPWLFFFFGANMTLEIKKAITLHCVGYDGLIMKLAGFLWVWSIPNKSPFRRHKKQIKNKITTSRFLAQYIICTNVLVHYVHLQGQYMARHLISLLLLWNIDLCHMTRHIISQLQ